MSLLSFFNNPITLAAAAVIAIGVIVYEIVNHQKEERVSSNRGGRGHRNPDSDSRRSGSSNTTFYENPDSNIRRRKREETATKQPCSRSKVIKQAEDVKLSDGVKDSTPNSEFDEKNYYKNVFDKIENDVKNINQVDDKKKTFHKNIHDDVSDSSASSVPVNLNENKLVNTSITDANEEDVRQIIQGASTEGIDRENIDNNQDFSPRNYNEPSCSAGATAVNDTRSGNVMCMACDEVLANAVAHPCKHCYMCADCANIVHRIYKKCTICESDVDHFEIEERHVVTENILN